MDPKLLTVNGWKSIASRFNLKDNGLLRALADYEKLPDEKHGERLAAANSVNALAGNLKKDSLVSMIPRATNYLKDLVAAAEEQSLLIAKAKSIIDQQTDNETKAQEKEEGDYAARLLAALNKLKSSKGLAFEFIVCDAKPNCALMVAQRITAQHKAELTNVTNGCGRFLHPGTCSFENGKFVFNLDQKITGLAKRIQNSLLFFAGRKFPVLVGDESEDDDAKSAG